MLRFSEIPSQEMGDLTGWGLISVWVGVGVVRGARRKAWGGHALRTLCTMFAVLCRLSLLQKSQCAGRFGW